MSDTKTKDILRSMINQLLIEGEDKPSDEKKKPKKRKRRKSGLRIATGAVGSGRFKRMVSEAGARMSKDPAGLMKDLGIKSASGATDLDRALNIIRSAIYSNELMGEAYTGASMKRERVPDSDPIKVIAIYPSGLDKRNAIKFMSHTLQGAINAGILSLEGGIELNSGTSAPIVLYEV